MPPQIEIAKLFDMYGLLRHNNPSSELIDTAYVSIKLIHRSKFDRLIIYLHNILIYDYNIILILLLDLASNMPSKKLALPLLSDLL